MNQLLQQKAHLGLAQFSIIVLTLITAITHLHLSSDSTNGLHIWFLLNGIGYIVLLVALYIPHTLAYHHFVRIALIAYTALTIMIWFLIARPYDPADFPTKIVEALLILSLVVEGRQPDKHQPYKAR